MLDDRSFAPESRLPAGARQARLMEMLTRNGFLSVAEAAERMGVSSMTIRRDLEILEARGVLTRTHGGAVAIQGRRLEVFDAVEPVFDQRRRRQAGAKSKESMYEFLPSAESILQEVVPASFKVKLFKCFLDSAVSEQIARMVAMKGATENAGELIKSLSMQYNRARQGRITSELMDLIGGVEALK